MQIEGFFWVDQEVSLVLVSVVSFTGRLQDQLQSLLIFLKKTKFTKTHRMVDGYIFLSKVD
jgi:hypothetical protein